MCSHRSLPDAKPPRKPRTSYSACVARGPEREDGPQRRRIGEKTAACHHRVAKARASMGDEEHQIALAFEAAKKRMKMGLQTVCPASETAKLAKARRERGGKPLSPKRRWFFDYKGNFHLGTVKAIRTSPNGRDKLVCLSIFRFSPTADVKTPHQAVPERYTFMK